MHYANRLTMILLACLPMFSPAAADTGSPLPPGAYAGRWDYDGRYTNTWSIVFDKVNDDGTIIGRITFYG